VVSLTYELLDIDGTLIEKTDAPVSYLHGGHDGIFARVQQALEGKRAGFECRVQLAPEDGFGAVRRLAAAPIVTGEHDPRDPLDAELAQPTHDRSAASDLEVVAVRAEAEQFQAASVRR